MPAEADQFHGWVGLSPAAAQGNLEWQAFTPKTFDEYDIDVAITHSSIDGSDLHVLRSGWGATDYPVVVGHEFVGTVERAGARVTNVRVGDRVGIGGQTGACLQPECRFCTQNLEQHCPHLVRTYSSRWPSGEKAQGGFAERWRGDARFAVKIPDSVASAEAAPLLCAGLTAYGALSRQGVGPGKRVGVVGIGGVGHLGILFACAMGASKVYGISRSAGKRDDALQLGADDPIATSEAGWETKYANSVDVILCAVSSHDIPLNGYLNLLDVGGVFVQIGGPEDVLPPLYSMPFALKRISMTGGYLGSRAEAREMFDLVAERQIHPWIENRPMKEINQALLDFEAGKLRYRVVLHN